MADIYSDPLYQENKRLHFENKALKEFVEALTHQDSVKIIQRDRGFIIEIRLKNDTFQMFCTNITFETEKTEIEY